LTEFCYYPTQRFKVNFIGQVYIGISSFFNAIPFIFKNKLGYFFLFPIILNILLFWVSSAFIQILFDEINLALTNNELQNYLPEWLYQAVYMVFFVLAKVLIFILLSYIAGYLTLILLSPVLSILSEKTNAIIQQKTYQFELSQFLKDLIRSLKIFFRNLFMQIILFLLLFIFAFIPLIGWFSPFLIFIISAYYFGFSFMDYTNEVEKLNFKEGINFIKTNKGIAIANGTLYSSVLIVPYIGLFLAGFAAIIATVGAALSIQEIKSQHLG
jgi:CysZ protein